MGVMKFIEVRIELHLKRKEYKEASAKLAIWRKQIKIDVKEN